MGLGLGWGLGWDGAWVGAGLGRGWGGRDGGVTVNRDVARQINVVFICVVLVEAVGHEADAFERPPGLSLHFVAAAGDVVSSSDLRRNWQAVQFWGSSWLSATSLHAGRRARLGHLPAGFLYVVVPNPVAPPQRLHDQVETVAMPAGIRLGVRRQSSWHTTAGAKHSRRAQPGILMTMW